MNNRHQCNCTIPLELIPSDSIQSIYRETRVYNVVLSKFFPLTTPTKTFLPDDRSMGSMVPTQASGPPESPIATSDITECVQIKLFMFIPHRTVHLNLDIGSIFASSITGLPLNLPWSWLVLPNPAEKQLFG